MIKASSLRKNLLYLVYVIAVAAGLLLALEGAARLAIYLIYGVPGKSCGLWISDPELGARYGPNTYNSFTSLNNYGFRNQEDVFEPKPEGSVRVLALGGSTTFGRFLKDEQTYPYRLEKKLRQIPGHEKSQVLNAGTTNFSAGHNLILMSRLLPKLTPDYVILYEGINEIQNAFLLSHVDKISLDSLGARYGVLAKGYDQNNWLKRNSIVLRQIDTFFKHAKEKKRLNHPAHSLGKPHPWAVENYRVLLRQMIDLCRAYGAKPIMVRFAYADNVMEDEGIFSQISYEIAREKGVLICDMNAAFRESKNFKDLLFQTGVHVTSQGAAILADELFRIITSDLHVSDV